MAEDLYQTWTKIDDLRLQNKFAATNVKLKVHKQAMDDGNTEYIFNLVQQNPSEKMSDGGSLKHREVSRRNSIQKLRAFARLYINGKRVSETKKQPVLWPNFEAQICEMFQVHVFTMPSSIQIEIVIQDGLFNTEVDMIDIEVPGQHVKTLTCAC